MLAAIAAPSHPYCPRCGAVCDGGRYRPEGDGTCRAIREQVSDTYSGRHYSDRVRGRVCRSREQLSSSRDDVCDRCPTARLVVIERAATESASERVFCDCGPSATAEPGDRAQFERPQRCWAPHRSSERANAGRAPIRAERPGQAVRWPTIPLRTRHPKRWRRRSPSLSVWQTPPTLLSGSQEVEPGLLRGLRSTICIATGRRSTSP